jgi:hypothetical protein
MQESMRSERFDSRPPLLPRAATIDKHFGLDEESGPKETDLPLDHIEKDEPVRFKPFRIAALWLGMAVLGVVLALVWRSVGAQLWSDTQEWLSFAAPSSSSASSAALSPSPNSAPLSPSASSLIEEQLGRIARDLDALKKNIDELRAAQQQNVTNVTSLHAAQQELQRRLSSFQSPRWYSDLAPLTHPPAPAKKPAAVAAPKRVPTARAPAQTHDANVGGNNNDDAPVSLVSPGR